MNKKEDEKLEKNEELPKWPDSLPIPDRIEMTAIHVLEASDVVHEEDIMELVRLLYMHPEHKFYIFLEQGKPINKEILKRIESFGVLSGANEFYYYKHPKFDRDYICIQRHKIEFDWEREVVDRGPMFFRTSLKLSKAMTRRLSMQEQMSWQKSQDTNPLELKPGFFGFAVDLKKLWWWLKRLFSKK